MDIVLNFIANRATRFGNRKLVGLSIAGVLLLLASALVIFSGMLIAEVQFVGVLLGSLGGLIIWFASVFIFSLFVGKERFYDFKEKFSIVNRRTISIVLGVLFLLLIALSGSEGSNPWIGASTVVIFGWLVLFYFVTPAENDAIEAATNEIVWAYENQDRDEEDQYIQEEYEEEYEEAEEYLKYGPNDMEEYFKELEAKKKDSNS